MLRFGRCLLLGVLFVLNGPGAAQAGMPSIHLTDVARMRVQSISFFLAVFLLAAWGVHLLWNRLRVDFPRMPRLSFGKAVGVVTLWGLLFVLVLTMISGARELMTPGAWEKQGLTYRLADDPPRPPAEGLPPGPERRERLLALRAALWGYAGTHGGSFPPDRGAPGVPPGAWRVPGTAGVRYVYVAGGTADWGDAVLAYEPEVLRDGRYVLFTNGEVRFIDEAEARKLPAGVKP